MGMNISDFFDMDVLIQILTDWSTATGIGIIAVDEKGEYMMDPIGWKDFCMKYTRGTKEGLRRCVKCDQEGQGVYFCHAGLIDFTADISKTVRRGSQYRCELPVCTEKRRRLNLNL